MQIASRGMHVAVSYIASLLSRADLVGRWRSGGCPTATWHSASRLPAGCRSACPQYDRLDCAEVTRTHEYVWVRDSKNPLGPALGFTSEGWAAFLVGVRHDEFDRSGVPV
ncbi:MAG: DUF397 domain-containing protein [Pseudonocardiaceae bacterium]